MTAEELKEIKERLDNIIIDSYYSEGLDNTDNLFAPHVRADIEKLLEFIADLKMMRNAQDRELKKLRAENRQFLDTINMLDEELKKRARR